MTDQPEPLAPAAPAAVPPTRTAPVGSALPGVDRAAPPSRDERSENARRALLAVRAEVAKAVVGQDAAVTGMLIGLLCRGHVLLEGVPGVAKTLLVRSLAAALDVDTKRVQFTPDLMPGDVTGSLVYDAATSEFSFREGPVFTNLLLADEINRTPPKTQASLLEAMEERQVSVDGKPRPLPVPFMVAATQNPVEYEGTYPLPEAQLDRFLLKALMPLPPREDEVAVIQRHAAGFDPHDLAGAGLRAVATAGDLAAGSAMVAHVSASAEVVGYIVDIARATRHSPSLVAGGQPPRRDRPAGHQPRLGLAQRPRLRHPRRRQGSRAGDARPPPVAAPRGRARGGRRGRGPRQRHRLGAGAPVTARP